jgi:hypothetical protein
MNRTPQHVIFGTGAIGLATLDALRRRGERGGWSTAMPVSATPATGALRTAAVTAWRRFNRS